MRTLRSSEKELGLIVTYLKNFFASIMVKKYDGGAKI